MAASAPLGVIKKRQLTIGHYRKQRNLYGNIPNGSCPILAGEAFPADFVYDEPIFRLWEHRTMFSNPVAVKAAALILLGFLKLTAGLCPMFFAEVLKSYGDRRVKVATSLALCFGGGVLLASCMLHMIPKVRESLHLLEWTTSFPVAEFIVCCGFFIIYLVEELVMSLTKETNFRSIEAERRINGRVNPITPDVFKNELTPPEKTHHVLILSALSLHSALEGLALGLQPTPQAVWMLFAAILIHAAIVLFSIGLKLVSDGSSEVQIILYMTISALSSPVGGSIGLAATSDDEKLHAGAVVTLQGLAAGAVLFVTFFEVLEKEKKKGGFIRVFCVILGFAIMSGFQFSVCHEHRKESSPHRKSKKHSHQGDNLISERLAISRRNFSN